MRLALAVLLVLLTAAPARAQAPEALAPPSVGGTPRVGEVLTAQDGTWSGDPELHREWLLCTPASVDCRSAGAGSGRAVTVPPSWRGMRLVLEVVAVNGHGLTRARSAPTAVVAFPPRLLEQPWIAGGPVVGERLALQLAHDGPDARPAVEAQWLRCGAAGCADVPGATGTSYVVAPEDAGHVLAARVRLVSQHGEATYLTRQTMSVVARSGSPSDGPHPPGSLPADVAVHSRALRLDRRGRVPVVLSCWSRCAPLVELREQGTGRLLASVRLAERGFGRFTAHLPLPRAARAKLRRMGRLGLELRAHAGSEARRAATALAILQR